MGPRKIVCQFDRSVGFAREGIVSEINGDKARFGRQRKRQILERKRIRELRKALGTKQLSVTRARSEDAPPSGR
jgi:hypothetical protein